MFAGQHIALGRGLLLKEVEHLDYSHQTRNYKLQNLHALGRPGADKDIESHSYQEFMPPIRAQIDDPHDTDTQPCP